MQFERAGEAVGDVLGGFPLLLEQGSEDIVSEVPPGIDVRRYRIVVGTGKLPRDPIGRLFATAGLFVPRAGPTVRYGSGTGNVPMPSRWCGRSTRTTSLVLRMTPPSASLSWLPPGSSRTWNAGRLSHCCIAARTSAAVTDAYWLSAVL